MHWFIIASLTPAVLLVLAIGLGGLLPLVAFVAMTGVVFALDRIAVSPKPASTSGRALNITLALVHFPLLALGVWAIAGASHLGTLEKVLVFGALGMWIGQVSNSNAHELIHASTRPPARLGAAVYISLLHGHHVSAHLRVHHVNAATDADPNSAPYGMGFWRYLARASWGEFAAGYQAETAFRARAKHKSGLHPYALYVGGGALALAASYALAGPAGSLTHIALAAYAQMQLLLSDYVQHYGLRRSVVDGKTEPVGPQHSWNAPQWYSSAMMLNAPRHSDHHLRPARAFPELEITPDNMPILPRSLPVMAALALVPPLWRKVMDRRVARWQDPA